MARFLLGIPLDKQTELSHYLLCLRSAYLHLQYRNYSRASPPLNANIVRAVTHNEVPTLQSLTRHIASSTIALGPSPFPLIVWGREERV